ncbi:hypothetical protein [Sedimenticola sp.]|uniref:hypothetical protein n=1 Tax=Sedimenticola sp. TaxID=1940285 RepID=UPI003D0B9C7A
MKEENSNWHAPPIDANSYRFYIVEASIVSVMIPEETGIQRNNGYNTNSRRSTPKIGYSTDTAILSRFYRIRTSNNTTGN